MFKFSGIAFLLFCNAAFGQVQSTKVDALAPIRFMLGDWQGTSSGEPGTGNAVRHYEFVLKDQFLNERNITTYPPQEKNRMGEVHEHRSFLSYDKKRKVIIFRQFHQEGFVLTYMLNTDAGTSSKLVFESAQLENVPSTWKAREIYEVISDNEFVETFEIALPDKPYAVYSRTHFRRSQP